MKTQNELRTLLRSIDHKGYPAYKSLAGAWKFDRYTLVIDHVQGDPFASPSSLHVEIPHSLAKFPAAYYKEAHARIALEDFLVRQVAKQFEQYNFKAKGSGKSGLLSISRCGQAVLERSACHIGRDGVEVRFHVGFPAFGRTINAGELDKILFDFLPRCVENSLFYARLDAKKVESTFFLAEDQEALRRILKEEKLVAFVANGSVLPRKSGISDLPMADSVVFTSPESMERTFELPHRGKITGMAIPEGITLIAAVDGNNSETGLINLLDDICKESRRMLGVSITVGVGHSCDTLQEISRSYQTAVDALGYRGIVGGGRTIYINDVEPVNRGKLQFETKEEAELTAVIKFGTKDQIGDMLRGFAARMDDAKVHANQYQVYMLTIVNCLIRLMQQYDLKMSDMFDSEEHYADIIKRICRRESFAEEMIPMACRMNEALDQARDNTTRKVIVEAKEFIQENYADPELSVDVLCRYLHMSPAYFSTVFKRETGQTYVNYLTEVRLQKAEELLEKTDDKTYEIAQKVGYQEQNYFSYVFKKRYGVSPTKYRGTRGNG